jgi:hypothetical protein
MLPRHNFKYSKMKDEENQIHQPPFEAWLRCFQLLSMFTCFGFIFFLIVKFSVKIQ